MEAALAKAGYEIAFLPLTDFELPADDGPLRAAVRELVDGDVAWLLLTSPNAVRALARMGWDGHVAEGVRVGVTGPGTARVLAEIGGTVNPWKPDGEASATGILDEFPRPAEEAGKAGKSGAAGAESGRVLLPQSALATDQVAQGLTRLGWDVERIEAYRTVPYPAPESRRLLAEDAATATATTASASVSAGLGSVVSVHDVAGADVVLTSPSAVRELVRRRGTAAPALGTRWIALGRPTAQAAEDIGLELAGVAVTPDAEGILAVLAD
ncbi:uroporphyrinogen-III synthase [Citricoccus sp. GCM10030269]|uniref:uroporphyrinogen-III synthase n=1 Tax=Citricoccus sp. GCM10030269 TaxID=3273388 RepID=UPI00360BB13A